MRKGGSMSRYACECCGGVFDDDLDELDAELEVERDYGTIEMEDRMTICDVCSPVCTRNWNLSTSRTILDLT